MDSGYQIQIKKPKHQNESENDQPHNCFDHLPNEIAIDILSRLPITSLIQFSFVSRSLNSLSHDPLLAEIHLSKSSTNESQCLIFHSDYPLSNHLYFLQLTDKKIRKIETPFANSMPEFDIIGSCNGLLCLVNSFFSESIYICNPFTRNYKELPKNYQFEHRVIVYGFGLNPTTNEGKVIKIGCYPNFFHFNIAKHFRGFRTNNRQISEVQLYSFSTNTWINKGILPYRLEKWSSPGVLVNGRLHWVTQWRRYNGRLGRVIVSYNLADDSFQEMSKPGSDTNSIERWYRCHLSVLEGCLSATVPVPQGHGAIDIWIMKEYGVNESWTKEYTIGAYYPVSMISHEMERSHHIWRNMFGRTRKVVIALCVMKSGEVLLEYRGGGLVLYDPYTGTLKELRFEGLPRIYQTTVLVGSLKSTASPF